MADVTASHLTEQDLESVSRGPAKADRRRHLAICEECRNAVERLRRVGYYIARPPQEKGARPSTDHPATDALRALFSDGLSPTRRNTVAEHLRACDECLAHYERVRAEELAAPPDVARVVALDLQRLVRKLREASPSPSGLLGRLMVRHVGSRRLLAFEPALAASAERKLRRAAFTAGRRPPPTALVRIPAGPFDLIVEPPAHGSRGIRFQALRDGQIVRSITLEAHTESLDMTARPRADGWLVLPLRRGLHRIELHAAEEIWRIEVVVRG